MYSSRTMFAAVLLSFGTVPTAFAQPVINEKALPKGTTAVQASASLEAAKKKLQAMDEERAASLKKARDASAAYLAPMLKKAQELAKSDKAYRAFLDTEQTIATSQKTDRAAALRAHYAKNRPLFDRIYKLSGGDPTKDGASLTKIFVSYNPAIQRIIDSVLAFAQRQVDSAKPPPGAPLTFTPPYAIQDTGHLKDGVGFTDTTESVTSGCRFDLHAFAMEGVCACSALGFASVYIDMPAGKTTVDISIAYDAHYKLTAAGSLFSGGYARASLGMLVQDATTNVVVHDTFETIDEVLAFMWFAEKDLPAAGSFNSSTSLTPGRRYLITFRPSAFAEAVNASWGEDNLTITPTAFNISFR